MVMISAHRSAAEESGFDEGSIESLNYSIGLPVEYVEFDVQRFADGIYFLAHDDVVDLGDGLRPVGGVMSTAAIEAGFNFVRLEECLEVLSGNKKAHVDFKFSSPISVAGGDSWEVEAAELILSAMPPGDVIFTTLEDVSVARLRNHFSVTHPNLLVGLSLGRDLEGKGLFEVLRIRASEFFPARRIARCRANLVVCERRLARLAVAGWARKRDLSLLVWTVDDADELDYWLTHERAWLVTTNFPTAALRIRDAQSK